MSEQSAEMSEAKPVSVSRRLGRLQFHKSGKFRVLQLADVQDGPKVSKDTIALIGAAIRDARPDLVVFSGNQIAGYDPTFAATFTKRRWKTAVGAAPKPADIARTRELVRGQIEQMVQPMVDAGVPWAVTYGNHDFQCGLTNVQLDEMFREFPLCVNPPESAKFGAETWSRALPKERVIASGEPGTFAMPVCDESENTVFGIVLADSGDYSETGGYGTPSQTALRFLRTVPQWFGGSVESIVFQHMPLPQYYRVLKPVSRTTDQSVEGYRNYSGQYFVLDDTKTERGGYLGEGVSCPDLDSGEFDILCDSHAYFAVAAGHDHRNAFVGDYAGIRMIATPTCGFDSYGPIPERRAARLFEFDIRHPFSPRTQLLQFGDLAGKPSSKKAYVYGMNSASKPKSEGVNLLHKPSAVSRWWHSVNNWLFNH